MSCHVRFVHVCISWRGSKFAHIDIYLTLIKLYFFVWLHFTVMAVKHYLCLSASSLLTVACRILNHNLWYTKCTTYSIEVLCDIFCLCCDNSIYFLLVAEHHRRAWDPKYFVCSPGPRGLVHICLHHQGPADQPPLLPRVQHSRRGKDALAVSSPWGKKTRWSICLEGELCRLVFLCTWGENTTRRISGECWKCSSLVNLNSSNITSPHLGWGDVTAVPGQYCYLQTGLSPQGVTLQLELIASL